MVNLVINLMSLSHSLVERWGNGWQHQRGGAETNKLSWWKITAKTAKIHQQHQLPCCLLELEVLVLEFNYQEPYFCRGNQENCQKNLVYNFLKYWHYWKFHPTIKIWKSSFAWKFLEFYSQNYNLLIREIKNDEDCLEKLFPVLFNRNWSLGDSLQPVTKDGTGNELKTPHLQLSTKRSNIFRITRYYFSPSLRYPQQSSWWFAKNMVSNGPIAKDQNFLDPRPETRRKRSESSVNFRDTVVTFKSSNGNVSTGQCSAIIIPPKAIIASLINNRNDILIDSSEAS